MTRLSNSERAYYEGLLRSAEKAYHDLRIGGQARVFVDQNGERVEFSVANAERLSAYIIELKTTLGRATGITGPMQSWML